MSNTRSAAARPESIIWLSEFRAVDRLVKQREEQQELGEIAERERFFHHRRAAEGEHQHVAGHAQERHARRVDRPPFHHPQGGQAQRRKSC
jgi:hypothetical protein